MDFTAYYLCSNKRDGGTSRVVMDQLCATLRSVEAGSGSVRKALLLALRGVSLTGGSIGADEASSFRKVHETVWLFFSFVWHRKMFVWMYVMSE